MTPNKEDYLKLIFELGGYEKKISNKSIVAGLNVSAASVSEMISKLEKDGFVNHSPYQGVQLTDSGLKQASSLVRKHRLWEVFLVKHLGYNWNDVHEEAEVLEHVTSAILSDRLEAFLDSPAFCPHGGIIPSKDQIIQELDYPSLSEMSVGDTLTVKRVIDETELLDYLVDVNLNINDTVKIMDIAAYEGPFSLEKTDGTRLQISQKAAFNIFVHQEQ